MINTDKQKIEEILTRGAEDVIVKEELRKKLLSGKKIRLYFGVDPTGSVLHLGHAVALWKLKDFQDLGQEVILLIGDFTARIGDPTGKDAARKPLSEKEIKENFKNYKKQASKILNFSKVKIKYNSSWLSKLKFADILKLASNFTVQQMWQRDMFKRRMSHIAICPKCGRENTIMTETIEGETSLNFKGRTISSAWKCEFCDYDGLKETTRPQPIYLNEFLYPLMQGYDSVAMDVDLEIAGNDQMFNALAGRTLQKIYRNKDKDVLTLKLLLGTDGRKMSKTFDNFIAIDEKPSNMFGKVMSIKDELINDYLELATRLSEKEILEIKNLQNPRDQKAKLAFEIVKLYHGEAEAKRAEEEFNKIFRDKKLPSDMPEFNTNRKNYPVLDLLCDTKLAASKNEAKRLVEGGAVVIDSEKILDWKKEIELKNGVIIKVGSRKFVKIIIK